MGVNLDLVLAIIPKIGSAISIPSSLFIISESIADHRRKKGTAIQRTLVGMSIVDVSASFAWFLSTWTLPEGTAPLSRGNMMSCNFQGFLLQLAVGAPLYNCSLALYYLLVIKFNWSNDQLVKIERYVHGFIITFTVGTSIAGLPLTMYNEVRAICWVIGSPSECGNSSSRPSDVPCDRGDWAWLFGILLFYGPLWICVLLTIIAMGMIYMQVRNTFKRNDQYKFQGGRRLSNIISNRNGFASAAVLTESAEAAHQTIDAAGQMSSRMSRFSAFSSNKRALKELQEALEHEEDEAKINHFDDDAPLEDITENQDEDAAELGYPTERAPYYKNPISTDSEMSGGIGLKSGWMAAKNEVRMSQSTSVSLPTKRALKIQSRAQRKQNMFATQAILYSASFFITWTPSTVWSVAYWLGAGGIGYDLASATCEPLQGFWNMLIFIRSRPSSQEKLQRIFGSYCCRWLELLPKMYESSNEDSRVLDMSSVDRRGRISNARFSHESMEVMASEHPHFEIQPENEKSVHFDTEPSILDSL